MLDYACAITRGCKKMEEEFPELLSFLALDTRLDLKSKALQYVLGLTCSEDGKKFIKKHLEVLTPLLNLTTDQQPVISGDAHLALLNVSAVSEAAERLLELDVIPRFLQFLVNPHWSHADKVCMILSNLTRQENGAEICVKVFTTGGNPSLPSLYQLVDIFDREGYNKDADFHYLATIFSNITQVAAARQLFLDHSKCIVPRLLPYTQFRGSLIRRGGVVGLLRNLCFEVGSHQWLLSEVVDILPSLLLPLAGPEQFEDDEMEKLPEDLQYLPDDKQREPDLDIRKMLIEAIMKLCSTKHGREHLRGKQTYLIVRELHKWEKDPEVATACENLVHILIADEPEPGMENLEEVELPEGFAEKMGDGDQTSQNSGATAHR